MPETRNGVSPVESEKSPEQIVAADREVLRAYEREADRRIPEGRLTESVELGIDSMAMAALPDLKKGVELVAQRLGQDRIGLQYGLLSFGRDGVWPYAGRFADAADGIAQTYVVLEALARKRTGEHLSPDAYVEDKDRLNNAMKSFERDLLEELRKSLIERSGKLKRMRVTKKKPAQRDIIVPIVGPDVPPLALAASGYLGCVRETPDGYIVESSNVTDDILLKRGMQNVNTPEGKTVWFVKKDETSRKTLPDAERLDSGRVLFRDKDLAVRVAADAIDQKGFAEIFRKGDLIMRDVSESDRSPDQIRRLVEAVAKRYGLLASHFGGEAQQVGSVPSELVLPSGERGWISDREANPNLVFMRVGKRSYLIDTAANSGELYEDGKYVGGNNDLPFIEIADQVKTGRYFGIIST